MYFLLLFIMWRYFFLLLFFWTWKRAEKFALEIFFWNVCFIFKELCFMYLTLTLWCSIVHQNMKKIFQKSLVYIIFSPATFFTPKGQILLYIREFIYCQWKDVLSWRMILLHFYSWTWTWNIMIYVLLFTPFINLCIKDFIIALFVVVHTRSHVDIDISIDHF